MKDITLKVKDIKEYILTNFGTQIVSDGFLYKKADNEFFYVKGDYTYIFNILLSSWSNSYSLSVRLFISQKKIESIYESILGKSHKLTLNQNMIERIYYSPDGRTVVKGDSMAIWLTRNEDLYNVIDILKIYYNSIAKPYFEQFSTLEDIDNFINNPPFDYSPAYVGSNTDERCMKGLIVAKLVNNPNYERLVAIYDEINKKTLSEVNPDSITNYNKVKEYLG
jgi:hypothetical protein